MTFAPVALAISAVVASTFALSRPLTTTSQPASASRCAQARPSPRLEAQTMALRPAMPRSMDRLLGGARPWSCRGCIARAGQFLWPRQPVLSTGVVESRLGVVVDRHGVAAPDEIGADEAVEPETGQQQIAGRGLQRVERRQMPADRPREGHLGAVPQRRESAEGLPERPAGGAC